MVFGREYLNAGGENGKIQKDKTALSKPYIILSHSCICDECKYIDVYTGN